MTNWKQEITIDVSKKSTWICQLKWVPNLKSYKKGLIFFMPETNMSWYETSFEVDWMKFQEIINLPKGIGTRLHREGLIKYNYS